MKIMAPVTHMEQIKKLSAAGADEFYFGLYDDGWNYLFGVFEEINRMSSFGQNANVTNKRAYDIIDECHALGKTVFLALNSNHYSGKQKKYLKQILADDKFSEADGIIIGDHTLIPMLREMNYNITLGTMGAAYNSLIIEQFLEWGINRIMIPRDVQIADIISIVKKFPDAEFEVFLMRNGCKYSDAYCTAFHARKYGSMCSCIDAEKPIIRWSRHFDDDYKREFVSNNNLFTKAFHKSACGLCAINIFKDIGIGSVKIVGRADDSFSVENDVRTVRSIMNGLDVGDSQFANCLYGMNCYYKMGLSDKQNNEG